MLLVDVKKKSKVKGCARVFQRGLAQFSAFHRIAFLFVKTSLLFCIRHPSSFLPFCRANQARQKSTQFIQCAAKRNTHSVHIGGKKGRNRDNTRQNG